MKKNIIKTVVFILIVIFSILSLNKLFQPKWLDWNNYYTVTGFYEEPDNTIETVFLGSSVVATGISPMELYKQYGLCTYNLATEQQPMLASYYWLEEAYRLHEKALKTVVLDVSRLRAESEEAFVHKALDAMELSEVKYRAVSEYLGEDKRKIVEFMFPFLSYHNRWNTLSSLDFEKVDPINGTRGFWYNEEIYVDKTEVIPQKSKLVLDADEKGSLLDTEVQYFERMVDFCKNRDIERKRQILGRSSMTT